MRPIEVGKMQSVLEKQASQDRDAVRLVKKNGTPGPARWTVEEYYKMYDAGLFRNKRVQLIQGEIIEMAPMGSPHSTAVRLLVASLRKAFGKGFIVDSQLPLRLGNYDEPEPDVAVIKGDLRDFADHHPNTAELVIEVADTSLRFDRKNKAELYAENQIEEYWIVNLKDRCVEVHRSPSASSQGFKYNEILVVAAGGSIAPMAKPNAKIKVAEILP